MPRVLTDLQRAEHITPANPTHRKGVPGLRWDCISSASCSREKASFGLAQELGRPSYLPGSSLPELERLQKLLTNAVPGEGRERQSASCCMS